MDGGLITLPLRAGIGGARLMLRTAGGLAGCAARIGGKAVVTATEAVGRASGAATGGEPAPAVDPRLRERISDHERTPVSEPEMEPELPAELATEPPEPPVPPEPPPTPPPTAARPPTPAAPPVPAAEPEAPAHVSEEPELVSEVAEPGAEDGAGASIEIAEPWPGYDQLKAEEIIGRLDDATPAELAAIELYESSNRDRQTVRVAVQRNLKTKTGRGAPN